MKNQIALLLAFLLACVISNAQQPPQVALQNPVQAPPKSATNAELTYNIIEASHSTFGYDVFADGKLMIHQASIPAMSGNEGFKIKDDAEKVAQLVIEKIKKGEMPPTVSIEEMQKIRVIK